MWKKTRTIRRKKSSGLLNVLSKELILKTQIHAYTLQTFTAAIYILYLNSNIPLINLKTVFPTKPTLGNLASQGGNIIVLSFCQFTVNVL